jgi:putative ABC transport system ATP-binding protein
MSHLKVKIRNLKKSFGQGETKIEVLKGINLDIEAGEILALTGKSGSGKSTMLSLLAGLDSVDSGDIVIDGNNISQMSEKELANFRATNLGIVFQQFHLISTLTALENVLLPLELLKKPNSMELSKNLLESVGLSHRAHHLPSELSGGECQRVALARALAIRPSLLLADEPSGNLDEETGEKVMDLLFKMVRETKTTLILVTHDPDLAKRCSRVVNLEYGSLA